MLIDTHCHLDFPIFDKDRQQVQQRAQQQGIRHQIIPAVSRNNWLNVSNLCNQHDNLHPAYGLHPLFMALHQTQHITELETWLENHSAIAIGECGLDFFRGSSQHAQQREYFQAHLRIAYECHLPLIIHARKSVEDIILYLKKSPPLKGVIHSFSGSHEQAKRLIDLGFYLGFGGAATYPKATRLQALLKKLPLSAIVLESDAPDQIDSSHSKQRNEPAFLNDILQSLSQTLDIEKHTLAHICWKNSQQLFNFEKPTSP